MDIEKLAEVQHEIWSHWMKYLFSTTFIDDNGDVIISPDKAKHWKRQMLTPYSDLTEKEKESDRHMAQRVIDLIEKSEG